MKEVLETIPVWDGIRSDSECFICDLMKRAEEDSLRYYLGPAVMVPEIRVQINRTGFCGKHFLDLAAMNKAQPLSLVLDTYYEESKGLFRPLFEKVASSGSARKAQKNFEKLEEAILEREKGCLVCEHMEKRLDRYCSTVAALFGTDAEFRTALSNSKGFCTHHTIQLVHYAPSVIKGETLAEFIRLVSALLERNLERVQKDVLWMSQKYKSENKDKSWNGCEDAHHRGTEKIVGVGRLIDVNRKK
ncbi:MAG: hypothetical protein IJ831_10675 [Spirochaetales bacterium]|nr:hypothetical protein [Spirochaetales bacterium]